MQADGEAIPDLENRVTPSPHLKFHWNAFIDLGKDRPSGFGLGPIPWSSIDRYARRHKIDDPDEFDRFNMLIGVMDREYCDFLRSDPG